MKTELFQCFDEQMNPTEILPRHVVHREGHWHQSIHCWVGGRDEQDGIPYLLVQKRHPDKDTYPNYYDISAAGHLLAGETVEDGLREVKEELGIDVDPAKLTFLGMIQEGAVIPPDLLDNEFCFVYYYEASMPFAAFSLQEEEVTGLYRIDLQAFLTMLETRAGSAQATGIELAEQGSWEAAERTITFADMVPFSEAYYKFLIPHLQKFGQRT
ncbi:isopentenyldiphosphate isomerase [Tumebacillus sp. BK434]|uniref:NUDIX hydrolase n=1 Tax=Tumebacillus sp. BK434 TaxID=2512169 RepID=UPI0010460B25|nr:NUDIX domain-containing protein [Tumebacillus sp. BK434]TCP57918.1 isopentenyldiphosphate isomerase [Tumebacillus sp. BK434]